MEFDEAIDLQLLRAVRAIEEHGSLTRAAAALGYSQPAVSQQLAKASSKLGTPLTERVGRVVRLTEAGRRLAGHASTVSVALDAARQDIDELKGLRGGVVRLVGFPSASPTIVPSLIAELADAYPGLRLTYVEAEPPAAVEAVRSGRADIALTFSYPGDVDDPHGESARGLSVTEIGTDNLQIVVPVGHPSLQGAEFDVGSLAGERWIAGCPRCRGHLLHLCERSGFAPRIAFETDNFTAVLGLVAKKVGVAALPSLAIASAPLRPEVVAVPLDTGERRSVHTVTAHGAEQVPSVRVVLKLVSDLMKADVWGALPA